MKLSTLVLFAAVFIVTLGSMPARAGLASGTPLFTWTLPTQNIDGTAIASTGTAALKEVHFYCDGATAAAPTKVIATPATTWQTVVGDFIGGSHTCAITAVTNGGAESARTTPLAFTVPTVPAAPSGLTVQ
jgi:hypothetical protein